VDQFDPAYAEIAILHMAVVAMIGGVDTTQVLQERGLDVCSGKSLGPTILPGKQDV
jgi:hypothetical protein